MGKLLFLIRKVMTVVGGGRESQTRPGGVAQGEFVRRTLGQNGVKEEGYTWHHGTPMRPLQGHLDLDGVQFKSWSDPVLRIQPQDAWLNRQFYAPGEHSGCGCSFSSKYGQTR